MREGLPSGGWAVREARWAQGMPTTRGRLCTDTAPLQPQRAKGAMHSVRMFRACNFLFEHRHCLSAFGIHRNALFDALSSARENQTTLGRTKMWDFLCSFCLHFFSIQQEIHTKTISGLLGFRVGSLALQLFSTSTTLSSVVFFFRDPCATPGGAGKAAGRAAAIVWDVRYTRWYTSKSWGNEM